MRKYLFIILTFLGFVCRLTASEPIKVIITAGQSNTEGRILNTYLPQYVSNISNKEYKHCKWSSGSTTQEITGKFEPFWPSIFNKNNPERWAYDAITYYWVEQALKEDFYAIKWSLGGTGIDTSCVSTNKYYWSADPDWLAQTSSTATGGQSLLLSFEEIISSCIDSTLSKLDREYEIVAFLWHQGESDTCSPNRYYDNLKNMLSHVRTFLVNKTGETKYQNLPFVYGTVSGFNKRYNKEIENAMFRLAEDDKNCYVIDMSQGELQNDKLHFTEKSGEYLGIQMYNKMVDLNLLGSKARQINIDF